MPGDTGRNSQQSNNQQQSKLILPGTAAATVSFVSLIKPVCVTINCHTPPIVCSLARV